MALDGVQEQQATEDSLLGSWMVLHALRLMSEGLQNNEVFQRGGSFRGLGEGVVSDRVEEDEQ